jgi:hypothetical protein
MQSQNWNSKTPTASKSDTVCLIHPLQTINKRYQSKTHRIAFISSRTIIRLASKSPTGCLIHTKSLTKRLIYPPARIIQTQSAEESSSHPQPNENQQHKPPNPPNSRQIRRKIPKSEAKPSTSKSCDNRTAKTRGAASSQTLPRWQTHHYAPKPFACSRTKITGEITLKSLRRAQIQQ